ncbi:hypothetical protein Hanom_Chr05g00449951 [Helianthus anomalus]
MFMNQENARKDLQAHEVVLADVNRRLVEAKAWATKVEEEHQQAVAQLDDAKAMNANLKADREWMLDYGVVHIANAILDAPETIVAVAVVMAKARDAGYRVGYTECLTHVNVVDTESELKAATDAYDALVVPALAQVEECLAADDYVDCLETNIE